MLYKCLFCLETQNRGKKKCKNCNERLWFLTESSCGGILRGIEKSRDNYETYETITTFKILINNLSGNIILILF